MNGGSNASAEHRLLNIGTGGATEQSSHEGHYTSPSNPGFGSGYRVSWPWFARSIAGWRREIEIEGLINYDPLAR